MSVSKAFRPTYNALHDDIFTFNVDVVRKAEQLSVFLHI